MTTIEQATSTSPTAPSAGRRRVLLIAFHFPPFSQSSGLLRTFCFARDLLLHGWLSTVLTVRASVYEKSRDDLIDKIPPEVQVERAAAWDVARDFAIGGRYPDWLALPDRWWSWLAGGAWRALKRWRAWRPDVIWSTYPIATAHLLGMLLARASGRPWIADFRDPMLEQDKRDGTWTPADPRLRRARSWIERACMRHATRLVFCTDGARQICLRRYGLQHAEKCLVIPNGFDEEIFHEVETTLPAQNSGSARAPLTLVHSGVIYASADRDPTAFLEALGVLKHKGEESAATLRVILRASGNDALFSAIAERFECRDMIELMPALPYQQAIAEMFQADGLLIFQGYPSNPAIPAKLYEYIRVGRPVFAMAHAEGETAGLVAAAGLGRVVDLEDVAGISAGLRVYLHDLRSGLLRGPAPEQIATFARSERARELAAVLDTIMVEQLR